MIDERHLGTSKLRNPPPGSFLEFVVAAHQLITASCPPFGAPPDAPSPFQPGSPSDRYWRQTLAEREADRRGRAIDQLRAAGFPDDRLAEPLSPAAADLVEAIELRERLAFALLESMAPLRSRRVIPGDTSRLVGAVCMMSAAPAGASTANSSRVAALLNEGASRGDGGGKLTRHQVGRLYHRFRRELAWLGRERGDDLAASALSRLVELVAALRTIWTAAQTHPKYRHLAGAELAERIHADQDLGACVDRVLSRARSPCAPVAETRPRTARPARASSPEESTTQ